MPPRKSKAEAKARKGQPRNPPFQKKPSPKKKPARGKGTPGKGAGKKSEWGGTLRTAAMDERVEHLRFEIIKALRRGGLRKCDLKRSHIAQFGVCVSTFEDDRRRALEIVRDDLGTDLPEQQLLSMGFYHGIVANEDETTRNRILARERLDKIQGLEKAARHVVSGTFTVQPVEQAEFFSKVREEMGSRGDELDARLEESAAAAPPNPNEPDVEPAAADAPEKLDEPA